MAGRCWNGAVVSYHRGTLYYALCDAHEGGRRCPAFYVPEPHGDPTGPSYIFAQRGVVFNGIRDAGWEIVRPPDWHWQTNDNEQLLCPRHARKRPTEVVEVALFDLAGGDT